MDFEDFHTTLQIRTIHNDTAVKTSRTQECRVQYLRTVRRRQDQKSLGSIKSVHLCKKLIQCLFTFIISTAISGITTLTYGVNLINKYDTWCVFLGFLKQISNSGSSDTNKHLYKLRTGQGEEWHICFSCNSLGKKSLTCSRRSHKQCALRKLRTNLRIFARIVQKIHNLLQRFLRFFLSCNIFKKDSCLLLDISLRTALADTHDSSAASFVHATHKIQKHKEQYYCWKQDAYHGRNKLAHHIRRFIFKNNSLTFQPLGQGTGILHLIDLIAFFLVRFLKFWNDSQHSRLECHFSDLIFIYHLDKFIVCDLTGFIAHHICHKTQTH